MSIALPLAERGVLPDAIVRSGIRRRLRTKLRKEARRAPAFHGAFIESLEDSPIAPWSDKAYEPHHEPSPAFFEHVLGPRLKYSCCYYPQGTESLEEAERAMLALTCERAQLADGMDILELGCGWGSLTLYMAETYPNAVIAAISNSADQRAFIEHQCAKRGIENVTVQTLDMNGFEANQLYNRVVSVETFEHMRNYPKLLKQIRNGLRPDGRLFVHLFCHRVYTYPSESAGATNWMDRYFFTGGMMPSYDLLTDVSAVMRVEQRWKVSGEHYYCTAMDWLENLDRNRSAVLAILERAYGKDEARRWFHRWRLFLLAVAEFFGFHNGNEWFVGHYLMAPTDEAPPAGQP